MTVQNLSEFRECLFGKKDSSVMGYNNTLHSPFVMNQNCNVEFLFYSFNTGGDMHSFTKGKTKKNEVLNGSAVTHQGDCT